MSQKFEYQLEKAVLGKSRNVILDNFWEQTIKEEEEFSYEITDKNIEEKEGFQEEIFDFISEWENFIPKFSCKDGEFSCILILYDVDKKVAHTRNNNLILLKDVASYSLGCENELGQDIHIKKEGEKESFYSLYVKHDDCDLKMNYMIVFPSLYPEMMKLQRKTSPNEWNKWVQKNFEEGKITFLKKIIE